MCWLTNCHLLNVYPFLSYCSLYIFILFILCLNPDNQAEASIPHLLSFYSAFFFSVSCLLAFQYQITCRAMMELTVLEQM